VKPGEKGKGKKNFARPEKKGCFRREKGEKGK